jgi:ABC-type spermidine/putrescine transport system permease subunit II
VPRELIDAATLDGGRRAVWHAAVWPGVRRAFGVAVVAVAVLSLGEVVASKLVQPPGRHGFASELFDAMHYGTEPTVAAMCLLQIAALAAACGLVVRSPGLIRL